MCKIGVKVDNIVLRLYMYFLGKISVIFTIYISFTHFYGWLFKCTSQNTPSYQVKASF